MSVSIEVSNEELRTVREGMRGLNKLIEALESGELEKVVFMTGGKKMCAVLVTVDTYIYLLEGE